MMADKVTYYAIVDDYTSRDEPAGVLRRFVDGDRRDESFGRDLQWQFSSLLHSAERGDTQYEFVPIDEDEADRIVARIREADGPAESPPAQLLSPATPRARVPRPEDLSRSATRRSGIRTWRQ
jgi:hypothetical protein